MRASGGHGRSADTDADAASETDPGTVARRFSEASALLARGACFALAALGEVTADLLARPTPCEGWDLRALLWHLDDSVAALTDALTSGYVGLPETSEPGGEEPAAADAGDPLAAVRCRLARLVDLRGDAAHVRIGDRCLGHADLAVAGALELTVHGWDVGRTTGARHPVPAGLALRLLRHAPRLVPREVRGTLFAPPVPVPDATDPGDLLVAYLGRDPAR
ncbi:maleylpyruvate isomerase family mycothiol-dependent enzyme [Spirillospora sp. NPDC049652]